MADKWDSIPVKGPVMTVLVGLLGFILAITHGGFATGNCDKQPLQHVYLPERLKIVTKCADVTGTVYAWRKEHDGDYHVGMRMDDPKWINVHNIQRQHGLTVVEFVPLMPHPRFYVGQRLRLRATKILDMQHAGWIEAHPVFAYEDVTDTPPPKRPNDPKLAPPTED